MGPKLKYLCPVVLERCNMETTLSDSGTKNNKHHLKFLPYIFFNLQAKLVITFVYLLVGMGVVAMCYYLLREEVTVRAAQFKERMRMRIQRLRARLGMLPAEQQQQQQQQQHLRPQQHPSGGFGFQGQPPPGRQTMAAA